MSFIYVPFSYLMKFCLLISGNQYVFALFFFALIMQIILLPLAIKQQKSQIQMAKVRPMEMAIRDKYKGRTDRATQQKMTMEIQEMYQQNGYNQLSGCLPLLIQLPIIFILFAIVRNPISYASNLTKNDSAFVETNVKSAIEFYQNEKESLIKSSYETEDEYNKAVSAVQAIQTRLGATDTEEKTEDGIAVYSYKTASGYSELYLSNLIANGREELEKSIEQKHLPASILADYEARGFEKYADELPNYRIGSLNLINEPDFSANAWLLIIPVLVFLTQFLSTKLTRKLNPMAVSAGANGNPMGGGLFLEVGMPLITAVFAYSMPAAIGVYWIWRTILGAIQSFVLAKTMPIPQVTEEQIAEAKKSLKGSSSGKKKKQITIEVDEDDDSYDDLVVKNSGSNGNSANRKPRRVEMLTVDDDDPVPPEKSKPEPADNGDSDGEQQ